MTLAIVLFVVAFGLVLLEVFVPSMGLLSIAAAACFCGSLVLGFSESTTLGLALVGAALAGLPILLFLSFKVFPHTSIGRKMILTGSGVEPLRNPGERLEALLGKRGVASSMLRPSGVARIEGRRVDVVTRGEMLDPGAHIEVIEVTGNRVLVRAVPAGRRDPQERTS